MVTLPAPSRPASWANSGVALTDSSLPTYRFDKVNLSGQPVDRGQLLLEMAIEVTILAGETQVPLLPQVSVNDIVSQSIEVLSVPLPPPPPALPPPSTTKPADPVAAHERVARPTSSAAVSTTAAASYDAVRPRLRSLSTAPAQGSRPPALPRSTTSLLHPPLPSVSPFRPISTSPTLQRPALSIMETLAPKSLDNFDADPPAVSSTTSTGSVPRTPTGDRRRGSTVGGMAGAATARRACNCDHSGGRRRPIPDAFLSLRRNVGTRSPMVGAGRATPSDDKSTHHQHGDDCPLRDLPEEEASLAMESPPADSLRRAVTAYLTLDKETQTLCLYAVDEGRYRAVVRTTIPVRHFGNWLGTDDLPMASASLRNLPALAAGTGHTLTLLLPHSPNTEPLDFWLDPGYTQRQMLIPPALAAAGPAPAAMGVRFEFEPTAHLDFGWAPQSRLAECIRFHSQVADPLPSIEPFPGSSAGRASLATTPTPVTSASGGYGPRGSGEPTGTVRMSSPDTVQLLRSTPLDQPAALTYTSTAEQSAILSVAPHRWRFTAMVFLDYTAVAADSDGSPASRLTTDTHWEIPCRFVAQDMDQVKLIEVEAQHSRVHWQLSYNTPTVPTMSPSAVGHIFRSPQVNESTSTGLDTPVEAELRLWVDPPPGTDGPGTTVTATPKRISLILVFEGVYSNDLSLTPSPAGPTAAISSATSAAPPTKPQFHVPRLTLTDVASQIGCLAVSVESPLLIIHELEKKGLYYLNTQDMSRSGSDASDDEDDASWASDASAELSISEVGSNRSQTTGLRSSNRTPLKTDPEDPADWDFGGRVDPHRRRTMFRQLDHVRRISLGPRALLAAGAGRASVAVGGGSLLRRLTSAPSAAIHPPPSVANDNDDGTQLTPTKPGPGGDGGTGTMGSDETPVDAGGEVDWSIFSSPRVALGRTMTDEALPLARRANLFGQLAPALALPLENSDDGLARETPQEAAAFRPAAAVIQDLPEPPLIDRPPREADLTLATPDRPVVYRDYGFSESDYALALQITLRPRTQAPLFTANAVTARLTVAPPRREDPASLIRRHRATPRRTPLSSLVPTAANPATGESHRLVMDLTIQLSVDRDRILHVLPSSTTVAARTGAAPTCSHAGGASHETARWATGSPTPSQPSYLTSSPHARRNLESQWGTGPGAPGPTGSFFEETTPLSTPRPSDVSRDACLRLRFPHLDLDGVGWWVVKVAGRRVPAYVMPHRELWVSLRDYLAALAPTSALATGSNDGSILSLTHPAAHFDSPRDATRPSYGGDDLTITVEVKLTTAFQFSDAPPTTHSTSHRTPTSGTRTRRTPDRPPAYTVPLPIFDMPVEHLTAEVSLPSPVADRYTIETALYELSPLDGADYDRRPKPRSPFTSRHYETTMLEPGDAMWLQIYRVLEEPKAAGDVGTLPLTATTPLRGIAGALDLGSPTKPSVAALVDKNVGTDRCAMVDRCTTAELDPPPPRVGPDTSSVACQANEADDQAARLLVVAQEAVVALDKSHTERVMALQVQVRRTRRRTCALLLTPFILGALSLAGLAVYLHLANDPQLPRPLLDQVLIPAADWVYHQRGELSSPPIIVTTTPEGEEEGSVDEAKYRAWAERHYVCPAVVPEPEVSSPTEASVTMTVASTTTTVPAERVVPPRAAKGSEQSDLEPEVNEMTNDEENPLEQVLTAVYGLWRRYYERLHLLLDPQRPM